MNPPSGPPGMPPSPSPGPSPAAPRPPVAPGGYGGPTYGPYPPPRRSPLALILFGLFLGLTFGGACSTCLSGAAVQGGEEIVPGSKERVGVVELTGMISDATEVVRQIRETARRDDLKAILVRIDSPGGAVAPSQEIFQALRRASKYKPVVASMGNVAASGGFWSALGADYIFASPGSLTGSIGVITQIPDLRGLAEFARVNVRTFKSGPLKDAGNPLREMTPADVALFTSLIDDIYQQFVEVVAERRKMEVDAVKRIADGRVMTGRAAKEAGLVDPLGGLEDAGRKASQLIEIRAAERGKGPAPAEKPLEEYEMPTLVYPKKPLPGLLRLLAESTESALSSGLANGVERAAKSARESLDSAGASVELR